MPQSLRLMLLRLALSTRSQRPGGMLASLPSSMLATLRRDGFDPAVTAVPDPIRRIRLPLGIRGWLVTGYDEVRQVLADDETFSSDFNNLVGSGHAAEGLDPGGLGFTDPPEHTRLRHALTGQFTTRRLASLAPRISAIIDSSLDDLQQRLDAHGSADLVSLFARPIPTLTICELLGVPYDHREQFQELSTRRFDLGAGTSTSLDLIGASLDYLEDLIARRRREPDAGLVTGLLADHGSEFTDRELAGVVDGLLTGGIETTASMLGLGSFVLLSDRDRYAAIAGDECPVQQYVEELLRYLTVVQVAFPRFARADTTVGGVRIRRQDVVLCSLSAAGRDPKVGQRPNHFEPESDRRTHLAFGHGIHRCLGAELARLELRTALPMMARRFPALRLADSSSEPAYRDLSIVFGLTSLPVVVYPRTGNAPEGTTSESVSV